MPYSDEEMTRYDAYVVSLKEATETAKGKIRSLGKIESGLEIFRIDVNPDAEATMCVGATIHGNEPSGALGVVEYLKLGVVPADIHLIVLPLMNPHGFLKDNRYTEGRFDLNRSFRAKTPPPETKMIRETLSKQKIDFLLSMHEDSESADFYLYVPDCMTPTVTRPLLKVAGKHFPIKPDGLFRDETVKNGMISFSDLNTATHNMKSFEFWVRKTHKCPYICTEIPTKFDLAERITCANRVLQWTVGKYFQKISRKK